MFKKVKKLKPNIYLHHYMEMKIMPLDERKYDSK